MEKRLYRSQKDKIIAGVCGGIAEHFNIDPVWVRLVAALLVFARGIGILLYIVLWVVMPKNPEQKSSTDTKAEKVAARIVKRAHDRRERRHHHGGVFFGILLIIVGGAYFLDRYLNIGFSYIWPLALVALGLFFLLRHSDESR